MAVGTQWQAVVFDLDGTLLDTLGDIASSVNAALETMGCPVHPVSAYRQFVGNGVEMLLRRALPADRLDARSIAEGCRLMRLEYARRWDATTRPYPGIPQLLDALAHRRLPMAVLSNKPDDFTCLCVERLLSAWRFAAVIGQTAALPRKPDPAGALHIARQLAVDPEAVIYVGDTDTDMQTARAAGMWAVGAVWGFRSADELRAHGAQVLLDRPADLLPLLGDWSAA